MDMSSEELRRLKTEANNSLVHMQDMGRNIDARKPASEVIGENYRERRKRNHFREEYEKLFRGNR